MKTELRLALTEQVLPPGDYKVQVVRIKTTEDKIIFYVDVTAEYIDKPDRKYWKHVRKTGV